MTFSIDDDAMDEVVENALDRMDHPEALRKRAEASFDMPLEDVLRNLAHTVVEDDDASRSLYGYLACVGEERKQAHRDELLEFMRTESMFMALDGDGDAEAIIGFVFGGGDD